MRRVALVLLALGLFLPTQLSAQPYPSRPIRFVAPFPAGSSSDAMARVVAEELRADTGATIVIENRAGAFGTVGAAHVARATPDGYTFLVNSVSTVQAPYLVAQPGFDPIRDFAPVARMASFQWLIAASAATGAQDLRGFIAAARAAPGRMNFGYANAGSLAGLTEFNRLAGIEAVGVSYRGMPQAITDMANGAISYMLVDVNVIAPALQTGRVRGLAMTSGARSSLAPDVPTLEEAGFTGWGYSGWAGLTAPAGTPREARAWLAERVAIVLRRPSVVQRMAAIGIDAAPLLLEDYAAFQERELEAWGARIRAAGIVPE
jgi:tripartite-type tricarboxylate transporter receptor subunit TctC